MNRPARDMIQDLKFLEEREVKARIPWHGYFSFLPLDGWRQNSRKATSPDMTSLTSTVIVTVEPGAARRKYRELDPAMTAFI
ncbi:hypothetical protein SB861_40265 [Paraburkholderia sp. SIMBA_049]